MPRRTASPSVRGLLRIDRSRKTAPRTLATPQVGAWLDAAERHFAEETASARQRRWRFEPVGRIPSVREALVDLFHGKCAFCETSVVELGGAAIRRFRPTQEAVGVEGDVSWPHYWWLAYEWDNLYLTCRNCDRAAGSRFPVRGTRAPVGRSGAALRRAERALLVDPCHDDPDEHLAFDAMGHAAPLTEAGRHTVEVFDLNRESLVRQRAETIELVSTLLRLDPDRGRELLRDPRRPYLGPIFQVIEREQLELVIPPLPGHGRPPRRGRSTEELERAVAELRRPIVPLEIERIEIRDFRGIERLALDFAPGQDGGVADPISDPVEELPPGRWTMLLGENGHGKTAVLQAVALALMGSAARGRLKVRPQDWVRRGADHAEIAVHTRGAIEPRILRLRRDTASFELEGDDTPAVLAAYGASRIPPPLDRGRLPRRYRVRPRVENLFDPHAELMPARRWLHSLEERPFDFAARALRCVTLQPETALVERIGRDVILKRPEGELSLDQLSDGYRAMIVLAVDLMSVFQMRYGSMDAAEGIVLIDEIGAHLHPRWQMRVVEAFRAAFPRVQVIATTHDPLCLRGMREREVVVLRRTRDERVYALPQEEMPPVRGLPVDELLTSEVFGLNSTVDEQLDEAFDRYYELLASADAGPEAEQEVAQLRALLDRYRQFGTTRRERIALEAADAFVAHERDVADPAARRELSDATRALLRGVWAGEAP